MKLFKIFSIPTTHFLLPTAYCLLLFFIACQTTIDNTSAQSTQKPFFDLRTYFQSQIKQLANIKAVTKKVSANGKTEEKTFNKLDFEKELAMFVGSDINRPAWLDKYKIQNISIENDSARSKETVYTTTNEQLKTKEVKVFFDKTGAPVEINIANADKSLFSDWKQNLNYKPGQGYSISNDQQFIFFKDSRVTIDAAFK